jgi:hypothetical protein
MDRYTEEALRVEQAARKAIEVEGAAPGNGTDVSGDLLVQHFTDLGNAKRFALQHEGMAHCTTIGVLVHMGRRTPPAG